MNKEVELESDFEKECENCGQSPTVVLKDNDGMREHTGLCGVCLFGEADCIDPEEW